MDDIKNLIGGPKAMYIRNHRDTILEVLEVAGKEVAMQTFNLRESTLDRLITQSPTRYHQKQTNASEAKLRADTALSAIESLGEKLDRFEIRVERLREDTQQNREAIRELKDLYGEFVNQVSGQISQTLILPLLQALKIDADKVSLPERPDPLDVSFILAQGERWQNRALKGGNGNGKL